MYQQNTQTNDVPDLKCAWKRLSPGEVQWQQMSKECGNKCPKNLSKFTFSNWIPATKNSSSLRQSMQADIRFLTLVGGDIQCLKLTLAITENQNERWLNRTVTVHGPAESPSSSMGAADMFRFQLYKEPGAGATIMVQNEKWCYLTSEEGLNNHSSFPKGNSTVTSCFDSRSDWVNQK